MHDLSLGDCPLESETINSTCVLTFKGMVKSSHCVVVVRRSSHAYSNMSHFRVALINLLPLSPFLLTLVILVEPLVNSCSITPCFLDSVTLISAITVSLMFHGGLNSAA